jgi:Phage integrase family
MTRRDLRLRGTANPTGSVATKLASGIAVSRADTHVLALSASRLIHVPRVFRIPGTKNATRDRTIDLAPQLAAALRRVPPGRRIGPVLRPWANACTDLRAACKRAGIERVTPLTFRHTFGTWLVQAGVDTFVVGKLMGHKDSKMVERYYGHLAPRNKSEAMARLPRFPALFPSETPDESTTGPCDAGVPNLVAIPGGWRSWRDWPRRLRNARKRPSPRRCGRFQRVRGVRAEGLEPSTSGLRVPLPPSLKPAKLQRKLRPGK